MTYSRTFFRDRIVLNNDFKDRIKLDTVPLGGTILLAAREFVVDGPYTLDGRDLVLLADSFDGSRGAIQVKGMEQGKPGPMVTIVCNRLAGVQITSTGAIGAEGAPGEQGEEGLPGEPAPLPHKPGRPGGLGGKGGRGGQGRTRRYRRADCAPVRGG